MRVLRLFNIGEVDRKFLNETGKERIDYQKLGMIYSLTKEVTTNKDNEDIKHWEKIRGVVNQVLEIENISKEEYLKEKKTNIAGLNVIRYDYDDGKGNIGELKQIYYDKPDEYVLILLLTEYNRKALEEYDFKEETGNYTSIYQRYVR